MAGLMRTRVINAALRRVGSAGINLPGATAGPVGQLASSLYDEALRNLLAAYPWAFATRGAELAELAGAADPGYAHAYQLPGDCVRVVGVYSGAGPETPHATAPAYTVSGSRLLTDARPCVCRYVSAAVEAAPPTFADALAWSLAFELAPVAAQGGSRAAELYKLYQQALDLAEEADAMIDVHAKRPSAASLSPLLAMRFGDRED